MRLSAATLPLLLKAMMEQPRSAKELIETTGLGHDGVHLFCQSMHEHGLVHIVWWDYNDSQYAPVYAFGPGEDTTERWNTTEQAILKIFGQDLLSRTVPELKAVLNLHSATIKKALDVLTSKKYLIKNPTTVSWRRNPHVAFPDRRGATSHAVDFARSDQRQKLKVPQQSWFSAIT
jgi:predicted HTH transcriptional regulator